MNWKLVVIGVLLFLALFIPVAFEKYRSHDIQKFLADNPDVGFGLYPEPAAWWIVPLKYLLGLAALALLYLSYKEEPSASLYLYTGLVIIYFEPLLTLMDNWFSPVSALHHDADELLAMVIIVSIAILPYLYHHFGAHAEFKKSVVAALLASWSIIFFGGLLLLVIDYAPAFIRALLFDWLFIGLVFAAYMFTLMGALAKKLSKSFADMRVFVLGILWRVLFTFVVLWILFLPLSWWRG